MSQYVRAPFVPIGASVGITSPGFGSQFFFEGNIVDSGGNSLTLDVSTPFELASISKTFTTTLYEYFVQGGFIEATAMLGNYFSPDEIGRLTDIPLLNLANYTSGLPADNITVTDLPGSLTTGPYTDQQLFDFLGSNPLFFSEVNSPGNSYTYSNLGFALLAMAVGKAITGADSYEALVNQYILAPLGMSSTVLFENFTGAFPRGFSSETAFSNWNESRFVSGPGWIVLPAYNGAGGWVSNSTDLMTWLQFNMGILQNPDLTPLLNTLHSPATTVTENGEQLGVGWFLHTLSNDSGQAISFVWKDGSLRGFNSYIAFLQTPVGQPSNAGAFVLTNSDGDADSNMTIDLLFLMSGLTPPTDKGAYPRTRVSAAARA
ncbi:MAG: serine hydrolase domain-containing protein [Bryobacteraceae bacterium]